MFKTGQQIECVMHFGCKTIRNGHVYTVASCDHHTVQLQGKGSIEYKVSRFKLVADVDPSVCNESMYVNVQFNTGVKQYMYECGFDDVQVGDYIIVPDRVTSFKYAIVLVKSIEYSPPGRARSSVVSTIDDSQYAYQERMNALRAEARVQLNKLERQATNLVEAHMRTVSRESVLDLSPEGRSLMIEIEAQRKLIANMESQ